MNRAEDISEEGLVISAAAAFSGKRKVSRVAFEDIEPNIADDSHIFCGMIFPDTTVVLMKGHLGGVTIIVDTSRCLPKEEQIDKGPNNSLMNLYALGKANGFTTQPFDTCT